VEFYAFLFKLILLQRPCVGVFVSILSRVTTKTFFFSSLCAAAHTKSKKTKKKIKRENNGLNALFVHETRFRFW